MKTILIIIVTLGLFMLVSCGSSAEEKANIEAKQRARADSLIKAGVDSTSKVFVKREDELRDSLREKNADHSKDTVPKDWKPPVLPHSDPLPKYYDPAHPQ